MAWRLDGRRLIVWRSLPGWLCLIPVGMVALGAVVVDTAIPASDLNPAGAGDERIATMKMIGPPVFDSAASLSSATRDVNFSATVGDHPSRVLVLAVQAEQQDANDCALQDAAFNGVGFTLIARRVYSDEPALCAELWYLLAPAVGTHTVSLRWKDTPNAATHGVVSLWDATQQAPERSGWSQTTGTSITTTVTTLTDATRLVDSVVSWTSGDLATGQTGQMERWDEAGGAAMRGASSTRLAPSAGSAGMTWTHGNAHKIQIVAAFASAN